MQSESTMLNEIPLCHKYSNCPCIWCKVIKVLTLVSGTNGALRELTQRSTMNLQALVQCCNLSIWIPQLPLGEDVLMVVTQVNFIFFITFHRCNAVFHYMAFYYRGLRPSCNTPTWCRRSGFRAFKHWNKRWFHKQRFRLTLFCFLPKKLIVAQILKYIGATVHVFCTGVWMLFHVVAKEWIANAHGRPRCSHD